VKTPQTMSDLDTLHGNSAFEVAIKRLEEKAKGYYRMLGDRNPANTAAYKAELQKALGELESEKRFVYMMADLQAKLDSYRATGRESAKGSAADIRTRQIYMQAEKHHPTGAMENYLRTDGRPKPSNAHTAHHIVPGKGKTKEAYQARINLHLASIRINDPDNGVWLVRNKKDIPHRSMPNSKAHLQYHTHNYERWVNRQTLRHFASEGRMRMQLRLMGQMLEENNVPPEVGQPPDYEWGGR
jgi:hypothetical protein